MNVMGLSVGQPWVLWALALCPLLVLAAWRNRIGATRLQRIVATTARVLAVALVVLAAADSRVRMRTRRLAVAFVADGSASVSRQETLAARAVVSRARIEGDDIHWSDVTSSSARSAGALESDLEASVETAVGLLPEDRVRRIVLATDGRETHGDVVAAADRARRAGVEVFVLPQGDRPAVDQVAVSGLEAPRLVRAGRDSVMGVRVFAAHAGRVRLDVMRDGANVASRTVEVPSGASVQDVTVPFPDEGVHEVAVRVTADGDSLAENNAWRQLVRVVAPPRVLLVRDERGNGSAALATVYRDGHLHVDDVSPGDVPSEPRGLDRYQFVALDEIVMTSLTEAQQRALRTWVEERGGGLLTTTGMHGVGREPAILREIEPIEPPRAVPEPRPIELILVVDRSGSMQGPSIVNARNAAIAAVRALRPDSRVGVVAFSGTADLVVPPVAMTESGNVTRAIAGIRAAGGTDLAAALSAAARIVTADDRYLHHVILLSDGESHPEPAVAAANELHATGATITAITLGPRVPLMSTIARIGHGRYHVTSRSTSLPSLFVHEAQYRSPPPAHEVAFRPGVVGRIAFMDGVNPAADPPVQGFTLSQPRAGSLTLLSTPDGEPLLSHWYVGLGQVATLTTGTSSRWADGWRAGEGFRRLFGQMAWHMLRVQSEDSLEMHVDNVPGRADVRRVTIVAPTTDSERTPIVFLSRGRLEGVRLAVHAAAPGVWTANVALDRGFVVDARMQPSLEPSVAAGAEVPYAVELRAFGSDAPALVAIAHAGGGRVIHRLDEVLADVRGARVMRDVRLALLLGALLLYLASVLTLRLPVGLSAGVFIRRPSMEPTRSTKPALALLALAASAMPSRALAVDLVADLGGPAGYGTGYLDYNDDGSSGAVDISRAFPQGLRYFAGTYRTIYVNNNGNITFRGPVGQFTPTPFPIADQPMIAPFWADVDTRGGGRPARNGVWWDVRPGQVTITWHNVGYYGSHVDRLNDFQIVLRGGPEMDEGQFEVEFRYARCQWTTGDASGGSGGRGGTPAQAGFDAGNRRDSRVLPGSRTVGVLRLCRTSNIGEPGVWRFLITNGRPMRSPRTGM